MNKKALIFIFIFLLTISSALIVFLLKNKHDNNTVNKNVNFQKKVTESNIGVNQTNTTYPIVDTNQKNCFNNNKQILCPNSNKDRFFGQDANYTSNLMSFVDNNDGTVADQVTGLIWQQSADLNSDGEINVTDKKNQSDALSYCESLTLAGHNDWRLPDIKTLYSLMNFSGSDPGGQSATLSKPFIDTNYFDFAFGDQNAQERNIDSQWASNSLYTAKVMNDKSAMFGLNLADGRIKAYPVEKKFYVKCVRGNKNYGKNLFEISDDDSEVVFDKATGLVWQSKDSGRTMLWQEALLFCQQADTGGYTDWRLPDAKQLQSILDYSRSPGKTNSPAISPLFQSTVIENEAGKADWGFYWTSTTHKRSDGSGGYAVYISFGRAIGYMNGSWIDVHGAGAQRSAPKTLLDSNSLPNDPMNSFQVIDEAVSHGPQGDVVRSKNFARCVRKADQSLDFLDTTKMPISAR